MLASRGAHIGLFGAQMRAPTAHIGGTSPIPGPNRLICAPTRRICARSGLMCALLSARIGTPRKDRRSAGRCSPGARDSPGYGQRPPPAGGDACRCLRDSTPDVWPTHHASSWMATDTDGDDHSQLLSVWRRPPSTRGPHFRSTLGGGLRVPALSGGRRTVHPVRSIR